jgi:hypothetical protein
MTNGKRFTVTLWLGLTLALIAGIEIVAWQTGGSTLPEARNWTTVEDYQNMMQQLGIRKLRPGPSGSVPEGDPRSANYDEAKANPFPDLPEILTSSRGRTGISGIARSFADR